MPIKIVEGDDFEHVDYRDVVVRIDLRDLVASGKKRSGNRPAMIRCFRHDDEKPSLAVYRDSLHCFGCGLHMSVLEWVALQEGLDIGTQFRAVVDVASSRYAGDVAVAPRKIEKHELKAWEPMNPQHALFCHERLGSKRKWFLDRGIVDWVIDEEKFGYDVRAFTIPIWSVSGELLTIRYRRDDDSPDAYGPKYWGIAGRNNVCLVNEKALIGENLERMKGVVVLCEGELDAFVLWGKGISAVSVTNGAKAFDEGFLPVFELAEKIVCAYDMDDEGQEASLRIAKMFGRRGRVMTWAPELGKDVTDLMKNVGLEEVKRLIMSAQTPGRVNAYWKRRLKGGFWR